ncbi:hypothetical protein CA831_26805, partial [Burkholderia multivorans]
MRDLPRVGNPARRKRSVSRAKAFCDHAAVANDSPKRRIAPAYSKTFPIGPPGESSCIASRSSSFFVPPRWPPAATTRRTTRRPATHRNRPARPPAARTRST